MWAPAGYRSSRPVLRAGARDIPGKAAARRACGGAVLRRFDGGCAPSAPGPAGRAFRVSGRVRHEYPRGGKAGGSPRADLAGPCSTQGVAPSSTRTRSQSGTKQYPAEGRRALLPVVQLERLVSINRDACFRWKGALSLDRSRPIGWLTLAQPSIPSVPAARSDHRARISERLTQAYQPKVKT